MSARDDKSTTQKSLPPTTLASLRQRFFVRKKNPNTMPSADSPLRCASLRAFPPAAPPHPPGNPAFFLNRFPLPSVARLRGALLGGQALPVCLLRSFYASPSRSAVARSARRRFGLAAGAASAPRRGVSARGSLRSHSSLALRAGGRRCRPARGSSLLRGRSPSLPSHLSLLAAPGAASLAAARLRSLPAPPLRACARGRAFFSGGAAAWLVAAPLLVAALAWRALCCCALPSPFVPGSAALFPPSPRRRRRSAFRRRRGCPAARRCRWPLAFLRSASVAL